MKMLCVQMPSWKKSKEQTRQSETAYLPVGTSADSTTVCLMTKLEDISLDYYLS